MKTNSLFFCAIALLAGLMTTSCRQDIFPEADNGGYIHSFTINTTSPMDEVVTRATDEIETVIQSMSIILIGKESGSTAKVVPASRLSSPSKLSSTNYKYSVTFDCEGYNITGGDYYMYAVANDGKQFVSFDVQDLNGKTKAEVDAAIAAKGNNDLDLADYVLMSGKYCEGTSTDGSCHLDGEGSTRAPDGVNNLSGTIHLRRIVSKISFKFEAKAGVEFNAVSFGIFNYSRSSTLMERDGWNGADPASLDYAGNGNFRSAQGFAVLNNSFFFYAPENVQKNVTGLTSYRQREAHTSLTEDQAFQYAPENATYVVVKGKYNDGEYSGDVTYTIHLGDFGSNIGNFSIRRNYKYNYTIKVNSVNNIVAECIATNLDPEGEPQPGAEGYILKYNSQTVFNVDAHYEQVFIKFEKQQIDSYSILANTPYSYGNQIDNGGDGRTIVAPHAEWVKFGAPVSGSNFAPYNSRLVTDVYTLIDELRRNTDSDPTNDVTNPHFLISTEGDGDDEKEYICIVGYVDEYFYKDRPVNTFVNADDRILTVALQTAKVSQDTHSTYMDGILFSIEQTPIRSVQNLSISNPFGLETVEESPGVSANFNPANGPSAGSNTTSGWQNFVSLLEENVASSPQVEIGTTSWDKIVDVAHNGYYSASEFGNSMESTYNFGFYQCLARNRDNNGNGKIDREEIVWYLPTYDQCAILFMGEASLPTEARLYYPGMGGSEIYYTSSPGVNRMYWSGEGFSSGNFGNIGGNQYISNWSQLRRDAHVRCVRSLKSYDSYTTGLSESNGNIVTVHGLIDNPYVIRTSSVTTELPPHVQRDAANSTTYQFEVAASPISSGNTALGARTTATTGNYCTDYSQNGDKVGWRVPSLKELYLMISSGAVPTTNSYFTRTKNGATPTSKYDDSSSRYYAYSTSLGYIYAWTSTNGISNFQIRCVRDYSTSKPAEKDDFVVSTTSINASYSDITSQFSVVASDAVSWTIDVLSLDGVTLSATSGTGTKTITVYGGEPTAAGKSATFTVHTNSTNVNTNSYTIAYTQKSTLHDEESIYTWTVSNGGGLSSSSTSINRGVPEISWQQTNTNVASVSGTYLQVNNGSNAKTSLATSYFNSSGYKIKSVKVTANAGSAINNGSLNVYIGDNSIGSTSLSTSSRTYTFDNVDNLGNLTISVSGTGTFTINSDNRRIYITSIQVVYTTGTEVISPNVFKISYVINSPNTTMYPFPDGLKPTKVIETYATSYTLTEDDVRDLSDQDVPTGLNPLGWYSDPVGGYQFEAGQTYDTDITMYAHWQIVID